MPGLTLYLIIINIFAIYIMRSDKNKSRQSIYRIPERVFFIVAALGGSIGVLFGMYHYRHKTRKLNFKLGIPAILIVQIFIVLIYFVYR